MQTTPPTTPSSPGRGAFQVRPDMFSAAGKAATAAAAPRPVIKQRAPRPQPVQQVEAAPPRPAEIFDEPPLDMESAETAQPEPSHPDPGQPPPGQAANVIRLLDYSRSAAGVAMRGMARAGVWSASASTGIVRGLNSWLAQKQRPRVDVLGALADAARYAVVTNRMGSIAVLSDEEQRLVRNGTPHRKLHQAGSELAEEGEVSPRPMFIMSGWACRLRVCPNGRTQIVGLLLPGDAIGLRGAAEPLSPTTISALTSVETVDAAPLLQVAQDQQQFPGVLHALRRMSAQQEEFLMNQVVRLGGMTPDARLAHLLLELRWRLEQAGLASEDEFAMPLTNETLADTTALGAKQVGNIMKMLRARGLVRRRYEKVQLMNGERLRKLSGFRAPDMSSCGRFRMVPAQVAQTANGPQIASRMTALPS